MTKRISNINLCYVNESNATRVADILREDGYDVSASDCTGYAMNIARNVAGAAPGQQKDIYAAIAVVLDVTNGNY